MKGSYDIMSNDTLVITKEKLDTMSVINDVLIETDPSYDDLFIKSSSSKLLIINTDKQHDHKGKIIKLGIRFFTPNGKPHSIYESGLSVGDVVLYNPNAIKLKLKLSDDDTKLYVLIPIYDIDGVVIE